MQQEQQVPGNVPRRTLATMSQARTNKETLGQATDHATEEISNHSDKEWPSHEDHPEKGGNQRENTSQNPSEEGTRNYDGRGTCDKNWQGEKLKESTMNGEGGGTEAEK